MVRISAWLSGDPSSIPKMGEFYKYRMFFLSINNRANVKYKFQYYISFFIDSVVVRVLAR